MLFHKQFFSTFFNWSILFTDSRRDFNSLLCGKKWSHCSSVLASALVAQQPFNSHNPSFLTFSHKGGFSMYSLIQSLLLLLPSAATPEARVLVMFQLGSCFNDNFLFTVSTIEHRFDFKVLLLNSQLRVLQGKQAPAGESQAWKRTKSFWMIIGCLAVSLIYRYEYEKQNFSWPEKVKKSVEEALAATRVCCRV